MTVLYLLRKELRAYFGSPLAYTVLGVSLALAGFFFYTDLVFFIVWGGVNLPKGLWAYFFLDVRFVMLFFVPALTMRLLAEEKKLGTIELLWTYPIRELSIVLGKFFAALAMFLLLLFLTLFYPLLLQAVYPFPWGPVFAGYLGLFLLGASFIAAGTFISSLTESQAAAAMATFGVLAIFWFLTWNEAAMNEVLVEVLRRFSLFDRFQNFAQGAIDSQEAIFFLCFTLLFLILAWQSLRSRHWKVEGEFTSLRAFLAAPSRSHWLIVAAVDLSLLVLFAGVEAAATKQNRRWDLTTTQELSLSPQAKKILHGLHGSVQVTAFYGERPELYDRLYDLLKQYAAESSYFHYTLRPLDRNKALAEQYGIRGYGKGVVEFAGRRKVIDVREESLNAAIISLMQGGQKVIYFLTGHGENDPTRRDAGGYSAARSALENENFQVKQLDLGREEGIPGDATVIVISGPRSDLLPEEAEKLSSFIREGGNLLFLIDPLDASVLTHLLREYGVVLTDDVVYDPENRLLEGDPFTPLIVLYNQDHPIVQNFTVHTLFPRVRSVEAEKRERGDNLTISPFAKTAPGSWARLASEDSRTGAEDAEGFKARPGPISVAVAVTVKLDSDTRTEGGARAETPLRQAAQEARLVVYGDSDFANNYFFNVLGNRDLFLNTVHWLSDEEELITTRPQGESASALSPLFLTDRQSRAIFWAVVVLEPSFVLLVGTIIYHWKKRRG